MELALKMTGISKRFPGVLALDQVDFSVRKGEIHSLIGQNGAGKSTLMKILAGNYGCDAGVIEVNGQPAEIRNAADAQRHKISIVYQELSLLPNLTVAENIFLGIEPVKNGVVDKQTIAVQAQKMLEKLQIGQLDVHEKVEYLPLAQQQLVEIVKALVKEPSILILDEPTAALTNDDTEKLFSILRTLTGEGLAIVFITHRMKEIIRYCDRGTILMNGKLVEVLDIAGCTEDDIIAGMLGGNIEHFYRSDEVRDVEGSDAPAIELEDLQVKGKLFGVSCKFYPGQINGITGLLGAGQNELARALFGVQDDIVKSAISVGGKKVSVLSPQMAIKNGIGLLTENRKEEGLFLEMTVEENITLASMREYKLHKHSPLLHGRRLKEQALNYSKQVNVVMRSIDTQIRNLSGGNQQKAIIAKWLMRNLDVLVFIEPTRGVDIGAKTEIYKQLQQLAHEGKCIIVVSNDTTEILGISDRILVMYKGKLIKEFGRGTEEEELLNAVQGRGVGNE